MKLNHFLLLLIVISLIGCSQTDTDPSSKMVHSYSQKKGSTLIAKPLIEVSSQQDVDKNISGVESETDLFIVSNPESIEVYVNKNRRLPEGYSPDDLVEPDVLHLSPEGDDRRLLREEAAHALEELFQASNEEGLNLVAVSGYRSNERQTTIYQSSVANNGQEHADQFSARPGTSEHETGLAIDVSTSVIAFALEETFQQTEEGSWLEDHAHDFGFIIRYPEGKEEITGYAYEPWHLRYVGKELADHLYHESLTLEEYFDYHY
ncbi:M15 family metallopeptidase [Amphibacillus sp. Q70]|uniref:M15 family metallopeptidase n=1 Tax=Amphibacillus sp. Q70 TaxID=3453416 RepID=UPI003F83937E